MTRGSPETASERLLASVSGASRAYGLMAMGAVHSPRQTLVLVGADASFWPNFQTAPEARDNLPHPIDRWSQRVILEIARATGALETIFPFGAPPFAPFIQWAKDSGEAFSSPVGMLVHTRAGMMVSYRGALVFSARPQVPAQVPENPCDICTARPCEVTCPVGALGPDRPYDVAACKSYLKTPEGADCMKRGCKVRRACPVSQRFGRPDAQSAYHMRQFLGS